MREEKESSFFCCCLGRDLPKPRAAIEYIEYSKLKEKADGLCF